MPFIGINIVHSNSIALRWIIWNGDANKNIERKGGIIMSEDLERRNVTMKEILDSFENNESKYSLIISGELLNARREAEISQQELSIRSGIPQKTVSRIETGKTIPNFKTIIRIANALDKKIEFHLV